MHSRANLYVKYTIVSNYHSLIDIELASVEVRVKKKEFIILALMTCNEILPKRKKILLGMLKDQKKKKKPMKDYLEEAHYNLNLIFFKRKM